MSSRSRWPTTSTPSTSGASSSPRTGRSACPTTAHLTRRPSCSWCARATPKASRTGTTWSSPASGRSRPIPRLPAVRAGTISAAWQTRCSSTKRQLRSQGEGTSSPRLYKNVPVLDSWCARLHYDLRRAWHRRRGHLLGERGAFPWHVKELGPDKVQDRGPVGLGSSRSRR